VAHHEQMALPPHDGTGEEGPMKPGLKVFVSLLLIAAVVCLGIAVIEHGHSGKWLSSADLMFDIAGIA
jgi:hypothetical protein